MTGGNLEFLDLLTIISFVLQLQNQSNIVGISDVQEEVNRAVAAINAHLEVQDQKIDSMLEVLNRENNQKTGGTG